MNIALIGYGRMGHEIEKIAVARGHAIKLTVDQDNAADLNAANLSLIDAAIEFSSPDAAFENVVKCLELSVPVVSGTTGWRENYEKAVAVCMEKGTSFIHSSNFSIGVNILYKLNRELAKQLDRYRNYTVAIEEIHHIKKLDAPSGTAITLADGIIGEHKGYNKWSLGTDVKEGCIPISSIREGSVPGTHTVAWESDIDTVIIKHDAKNRVGFALGAVVAAEFISSRKGIFTMSDVMGF